MGIAGSLPGLSYSTLRPLPLSRLLDPSVLPHRDEFPIPQPWAEAYRPVGQGRSVRRLVSSPQFASGGLLDILCGIRNPQMQR